MRKKTLQEERRVQQKKEKDQTHHTNNNNKGPVSNHNQKQEQKRVRLVPRPTSSCRIYSTTHHNGSRRRGHREGGKASTLTGIHICHRPRIPSGHVLIEHRCAFKHCKKREGCNKEKKEPNPPHKQQQKGPVSNHNQKQEQHV